MSHKHELGAARQHEKRVEVQTRTSSKQIKSLVLEKGG